MVAGTRVQDLYEYHGDHRVQRMQEPCLVLTCRANVTQFYEMLDQRETDGNSTAVGFSASRQECHYD